MADRCLKTQAKVLGVRGDEFTENMIGNALATRELMKKLKEIGQMSGGLPLFQHETVHNFCLA